MYVTLDIIPLLCRRHVQEILRLPASKSDILIAASPFPVTINLSVHLGVVTHALQKESQAAGFGNGVQNSCRSQWIHKCSLASIWKKMKQCCICLTNWNCWNDWVGSQFLWLPFLPISEGQKVIPRNSLGANAITAFISSASSIGSANNPLWILPRKPPKKKKKGGENLKIPGTNLRAQNSRVLHHIVQYASSLLWFMTDANHHLLPPFHGNSSLRSFICFLMHVISTSVWILLIIRDIHQLHTSITRYSLIKGQHSEIIKTTRTKTNLASVSMTKVNLEWHYMNWVERERVSTSGK